MLSAKQSRHLGCLLLACWNETRANQRNGEIINYSPCLLNGNVRKEGWTIPAALPVILCHCWLYWLWGEKRHICLPADSTLSTLTSQARVDESVIAWKVNWLQLTLGLGLRLGCPTFLPGKVPLGASHTADECVHCGTQHIRCSRTRINHVGKRILWQNDQIRNEAHKSWDYTVELYLET